MQQVIQFETIVERGIIRIPDQYITSFPSAVKVTVAPVNKPSIKIGAKSKAGEIDSADFSALKGFEDDKTTLIIFENGG